MLSRDDILRMARAAGLMMRDEPMHGVAHFASLVAAAEREACAVAAEKQARWIGYNVHAEAIAAAIRARGQQRPEPTGSRDPIRREQARLEMEAWARAKLARHGIQIPEDEDYGNPSF
jgi:hypothetical protein